MTMRSLSICAAACLLPGLAACHKTVYDLDKATRPYPFDLHRPDSVDMQVFREGTKIEIVNSTPTTYRACDVWVNQRYMRHVEALAAGETLRLSLFDFYDERGERFSAGGFFATQPATPVRLVELQVSPDEPIVGLISIRPYEGR